MDVFRLRELLVSDYADYVRSFVRIRNARLDEFVTRSMDEEALWPQPQRLSGSSCGVPSRMFPSPSAENRSLRHESVLLELLT